MRYKIDDNQKAYENRGKYDPAEYHGDNKYIAKRNEINARKNSGTLLDEYTGRKITAEERADLDHVISAKEIHADRGRVLAGLSGAEFAKDTAMAAGKLGAVMGLKQALGFMFANIWFSVKEEFQKAELSAEPDMGEFFTAIGYGVKNGIAQTQADDILKKLSRAPRWERWQA